MATIHVSDESETEDMEVDRLIKRAKVDPPRFSLGAESLLALSSSKVILVGEIPKTP